MRTHRPSPGEIAAELGPLRRYALMLTRDPDRAEDLAQETLAKAIAAAGTWRPSGRGDSGDLRRWLLAIAHNAHVSARRKHRGEVIAIEQAGLLSAAEAAPAPQLGRVHLTQTLAALMALPDEQREALALVAFEGVAYKEAAEILGIPLGTLMSRLARGREALRAATDRGRNAGAEIGTGARVVARAAERPGLRVVEGEG